MKKFFKYIEPLWTGRDGKLSLRSLAAMALIVDFVLNVHNCSYVVIKVLKLITIDKTIDAGVIASLSGYLAQIAMILGIEAALIAALLALKTYQPFNTGGNGNYYQQYPTVVNQPTPNIEQPQ